MVDVNCPHHEWLFHDLMRSSDGIHACMARPQEWKDANMTHKDYCECDSDKYENCRWYKRPIVDLHKEKTRG